MACLSGVGYLLSSPRGLHECGGDGDGLTWGPSLAPSVVHPAWFGVAQLQQFCGPGRARLTALTDGFGPVLRMPLRGVSPPNEQHFPSGCLRGDTPLVPDSTLIVVPTLGQPERLPYLHDCLASIRDQAEVRADITVVTPRDAHEARALAAAFDAAVLDDPGSLPAAINTAITTHGPGHRFVNWLGDDDLLAPYSLAVTSSALRDNPGTALVHGHCQYINPTGHPIWLSKASPHATRWLRYGPCLIAQPGALFHVGDFLDTGGLDEGLQVSFDLDLWLRLRPYGQFMALPRTVASFRWHPGSLTASNRTRNIRETRIVQRRYHPGHLTRFAPVWEFPVNTATRLAAHVVAKRATHMRTIVDAD